MRSGLNSGKHPIAATAAPAVEETYGLRGLNLTSPDEIMPAGESPWTINSRMYARNDGESRVASRTRMGASHFSTPVGAATDTQNITTSIGDQDFSATKIIAVPIIFTNAGSFTRLDTDIKKIGLASGHVIVELFTNNSGFPGILLAQSSIYASGITTSYQYLTTHFIDAPTIDNVSTYWIVYYIQDNGSGSYYINKTSPGATSGITSSDGGTTWGTISASTHFKAFVSTPGAVKGFAMRYPSDPSQNRVIMAQGQNVYAIPQSTGVPVSIDSGLSVSASKYRFEQVADSTIYANGFDVLKQYDGTMVTAVPNVPIVNPDNVLAWQNRLFVYKGTRVIFSELGDRTTWPAVNFFYIPITTPQSPDHITGCKIFHNDLVFWTSLTKYQVVGSNISNFTYREVVGTKGAVSQEAIAIDRNHCYFMAPDKQIYRWNGTTDELLSLKVQPELQGISDTSTVRLHLYRNQLRVYYTKTGGTFNNRMLLFDIDNSTPTDMQWFIDTDHPVIGSTNMYLDQGDPLIEFSSLVGRVMYGETLFSDMGKAIDYKYWTNYKTYAYRRRNGQTFGGASAKKRIKRFRPVIRTENSDYTMSIGKDMDFNNTPDMRAYVVSGGAAKFGSFKWADGTRWGKVKQVMNKSGMSGRGGFIQYRFERKGVETPVELYGYIAQYKVGKQR